MTGTRKKSSRPPGRRPAHGKDHENIRARLLLAARQAFALHGFRGTTLRQIAERAEVSPAMIHYHFEHKRGLYHAMLEETVGPMLERLQDIAASGESDSLEAAVSNYMRQVASTPELPALLMRDVLAADGAMRDTFARDFAARGAQAMRHILERDRATGRLHPDLDSRLALLSLLSMAVFPFIGRPLAEQVLGLDYSGDFVERLAAHTTALFYHGAANQERNP